MSKAYLCVELDTTTSPPTEIGIDVFSESANTLTCHYRTISFLGLRSFTGKDFHEAAQKARAYLFSDKFLQEYPQYKGLIATVPFPPESSPPRQKAKSELDLLREENVALKRREAEAMRILIDQDLHPADHPELAEWFQQRDEWLDGWEYTDTESAQLRDLLELIGVTDVLKAHGLVAACLEAQDKLYGQRGNIQQCVGNLLAVIHRDGGHYMGEHGLEKACKDAEQIVYALRTELDVLGESHDILVKSESPW